MNILYATDKNYAAICATSMVSLLENNRDAEEICIYLMSDNLNEEEAKFIELVNRYGRNLIIIQTDSIIDELKKEGIPRFNGGYTSYLRLVSGEYLKEIDKVLYIDCDTLVVGNIEEFYNTNLNNIPAAGVVDILNSSCNLALDRPKTAPYYNAGVLLINLEYWRMDKAFQKFINSLTNLNLNKTATVSDQELINYVYGDIIKKVDLKYNVIQPNRIYKPKNLYCLIDKTESMYYSTKEIEDSVANPRIIHFTGYWGMRPWYLNGNDKEERRWEGYLQKTPWNDYIKKNYNRTRSMKYSMALHKLLPEKLFVLLKKNTEKYKMWKKRR